MSQVESGHTVSDRVEGGGAFLVEGNLVLDGLDHCLEPNLQRSSKGGRIINHISCGMTDHKRIQGTGRVDARKSKSCTHFSVERGHFRKSMFSRSTSGLQPPGGGIRSGRSPKSKLVARDQSGGPYSEYVEEVGGRG